jgi:hypothetical protein
MEIEKTKKTSISRKRGMIKDKSPTIWKKKETTY